jgi:riboflavin synthase
VAGHVDGVGTVVTRRPGEGAVWFGIEAPPELLLQIAPRGSLAVDGVSLTVASMRGRVVDVSIVPYTLEVTLFGEYAPGRRVHLETDVLAKYVERMLTKEEGTSLASHFPDVRNES